MQIDGKFTFKTLFSSNIVNWSEGTLICENDKAQRHINNQWKKWKSGKYFPSTERQIIAFVEELEAFAADEFVSATWIDKPEIRPIERVEGRIY